MSADETEIYEFLKRFPDRFVSVNDISKSVGPRKNFHKDRNCALPMLRRMELEGWIEVNAFGEYRAKARSHETTAFLKALDTPGVPLGDTTIITVRQADKQSAKAA